MDQRWVDRGRAIRQARARRWPTVQEFAAATGLSVSVLDDVENGRRGRFAVGTITAIEAALQWEPGSFDRLGEGLPAQPEEDALLARVQDAWPRLSVDARRILAELAETALRDR